MLCFLYIELNILMRILYLIVNISNFLFNVSSFLDSNDSFESKSKKLNNTPSLTPRRNTPLSERQQIALLCRLSASDQPSKGYTFLNNVF